MMLKQKWWLYNCMQISSGECGVTLFAGHLVLVLTKTCHESRHAGLYRGIL